ncbi:MAG TPA: RNA methyltransferase [Clostridia bacterium]|jgi:TrmH family RNA methyltransferase|nr:RNA methyltransferase [Clostridia bacterium]
MEVIKSLNNETIKYASSLKEKKNRQKEGAFLVEGNNLIKDMSGQHIKELFIQESLASKNLEIISLKTKENEQIRLHYVADNVFTKLSETVTSAGLVAICKNPSRKPIGEGHVVVFDRIRDPGNLGTLLRTTLAMGVNDAVLIDCVDPFNAKVIRSSLGAVLRVNIIQINDLSEINEEILDKKIVALDMFGKNIYEFHEKSPLVLVVGNEASGVSKKILDSAAYVLSIPMPGCEMESLNAAISFSIALSYIVSAK